jgi:predicted transcriptional regulator
VRLSIVEDGGTIIYNDKFLQRVSREKILVLGYALEREKEEKAKLTKLIKEINMQTNFAYKFMMFQDKLEAQRNCEIY